MKKIITLVLCLIASPIFCLEQNEILATVVEKLYQPGVSGSGVSTNINHDGKVGLGLVNISSSEEFRLLLKYEIRGTQKAGSFQVNPDIYASVSMGDQCVLKKGFFGYSVSRKWDGNETQNVPRSNTYETNLENALKFITYLAWIGFALIYAISFILFRSEYSESVGKIRIMCLAGFGVTTLCLLIL